MSDDSNVPDLSKRDVLKGAGLTGAAALGVSSVNSASAQTSEPRIQLGQDWVIDDRNNSDELVLEHKPSGASFKYDSNSGEWVLGDDLNAGGNAISNAESIETEQVNTINKVSAGEDIQTAVNDLPASGGTVLLEAGTHPISSPVTLGSSVTLRGVGYASELKIADNTTIKAMVEASDAMEIIVRDIFFNINGTNGGDGNGIEFNTVDKAYIDSNWFDDGNANNDAIFLGESNTLTDRYGSWVINNDIRNTDFGMRILTKTNQYSRIAGNQFYELTADAIYHTSENDQIINNTATNCSNLVTVNGDGKSIIIGNEAKHCARTVSIENTGAKDCLVVSNNATKNGVNIYCTGGDNIIGFNQGNQDVNNNVYLDGSSASRNLVIGNQHETDQNSSHNGILEANSADGNFIFQNMTGPNTGGHDVNSGVVGGNIPRVTFESAPSTTKDLHPVVATSSWDPDADSNGEIVVTDDGGTTWHEIVDLPNI